MSNRASKLSNMARILSPGRIDRRNRRRPSVRLLLETLEDRVVPAGNAQGVIEGIAFIDANGNGTFDAREVELPGARARLTGTTTTGDAVNVVAVADDTGAFRFDNVNPGNYQVNGNAVPGFSPTSSDFGNIALNEGDTVPTPPGNIGFSAMSTENVSLRQFLTSSTLDDFYSSTGNSGSSDAFRENNRPRLSTLIPDQTIGKNATETIDLAGFFTDDDFTNSTVQFNLRFNDTPRTITAEMFDTTAPQTVANFFNYILDNDYDDSIFHRLDDDFVIQGGGFTFNTATSTLDDIPSDPPVQNEFGASNTFGTIALAKLDGDPNSGTNEFFFNLGDNSGPPASLDTQNGGFTVFGQIEPNGSTNVLNDLNDLQSSDQGDPFDEIPLIDYTGTNFPTDATADNFVVLEDIEIIKRDEFLTYSVEANDNPGLLTATIDQNRLVLDPLADQLGDANLTIRGTDRFGASLETTFNVTVENQAPVASVELNTSRPLPGTQLEATVEASDPNGDAFTLTYEWKVNGTTEQTTANTTNLTDTFDLTGFNPGDNVTVEVTPDDGVLTGTTATDQAIINRRPETTGIADQTFSGPGEFFLDVFGDFSDPDGDSLTFDATLNGGGDLPDWLEFSTDGNFTGNPAVADEATLDIEVTVTDVPAGETVSTTFELEVSNTPDSLNDNPVVDSVAFDPNPPGPTDDLIATAAPSDADGDNVTLTYIWEVNGIEVQNTPNTADVTDTLDLTAIGAVSGDLITVEVTPNDGISDGDAVTEQITVTQ